MAETRSVSMNRKAALGMFASDSMEIDVKRKRGILRRRDEHSH